MTRPASDVLADLAALASRQAELTAELGRALLVAPVVTPLPAPAAAPEYLTTAEAAEMLGVSASHLKALRAAGAGPEHLRVGRSVRYPRAGLSSAVRAPSSPSRALPSAAPRTPRFRALT